MGQRVVALMFGVRASVLGPEYRVQGGPFEGEWIWEEDGPHDLVPHTAYEGDCVGFKVAASVPDDDEDGLVTYDESLGCAPGLSPGELETAYAARIRLARAAWARFAAWLLGRSGLWLPEPQLLITLDERA